MLDELYWDDMSLASSIMTSYGMTTIFYEKTT